MEGAKGGGDVVTLGWEDGVGRVGGGGEGTGNAIIIGAGGDFG